MSKFQSRQTVITLGAFNALLSAGESPSKFLVHDITEIREMFVHRIRLSIMKH